ncbi:MAG: cell division protein SepF [Nanoarchaeota archaeon]|nr:cell division protein SepF [Nanoarchaeota archaeon]
MVLKGLKKFTESLFGTNRVSYEANMEEEPEEYFEVTPKKNKLDSKLTIKYFLVNDYGDIKNILDYVREGNTIVIANIKTLKGKDITELKRAIQKIKKTCEAVGGDIVGLEENFLLIHPSDIIVSKEDLA